MVYCVLGTLTKLTQIKSGEPGEKPLEAEKRTNTGAHPTYDAESGNRTRATLEGGECSHHCVTLAPQ